MDMETATVKFPNRIMAQEFATAYSRFSHKWNVISSWVENVSVYVDVVDGAKEWIEKYISLINK